jgi:hypothetical protein
VTSKGQLRVSQYLEEIVVLTVHSAFGAASIILPRNRLCHFHGGSAFWVAVAFCRCGEDC